MIKLQRLKDDPRSPIAANRMTRQACHVEPASAAPRRASSSNAWRSVTLGFTKTPHFNTCLKIKLFDAD
jgi:hypothetical protein